MKYLYVVLSSTPGKFARMIRRITKAKYSHSSISLNEDLTEIYSFARKNHYLPLKAGCIKENATRMTCKNLYNVNIAVYSIPVSDIGFDRAVEFINEVKNDDSYLYNLYSVLTFPFLHGFKTYKAYTCSEFSAHILQKAGFNLNKPPEKIQPIEFYDYLKGYKIFEGSLMEYRNYNIDENSDFFKKPPRYKAFTTGLTTLTALIKRKALGR